jgi:hypothetical protein
LRGPIRRRSTRARRNSKGSHAADAAVLCIGHDPQFKTVASDRLPSILFALVRTDLPVTLRRQFRCTLIGSINA